VAVEAVLTHRESGVAGGLVLLEWIVLLPSKTKVK
jgi:hypothetical protein